MPGSTDRASSRSHLSLASFSVSVRITKWLPCRTPRCPKTRGCAPTAAQREWGSVQAGVDGGGACLLPSSELMMPRPGRAPTPEWAAGEAGTKFLESWSTLIGSAWVCVLSGVAGLMAGRTGFKTYPQELVWVTLQRSLDRRRQAPELECVPGPRLRYPQLPAHAAYHPPHTWAASSHPVWVSREGKWNRPGDRLLGRCQPSLILLSSQAPRLALQPSKLSKIALESTRGYSDF